MTFDLAASKALFAAVESAAAKLGVFARVNTPEPANAPGRRLSCSIVLGPIVPDLSSGLDAVSVTVTFLVRVFSPMNQKPLDAIDPEIAGAVSMLMGAFAGGFTFGGTVRNIDLFRMRAEPGYLQQDGNEYRVETITLPVIINDAWAEVP